MNLTKLGKLYRMMFFADKWNIGYVNQTPESLIREKKLNGEINWLTEDSADYCADPFIIAMNGTRYIYYEHLNHWSGLGKIYLIKNMDFRTKKRVNGLDQKLHLSYPYIFKEGENIYCIPETARANEISLYSIDPHNPTEIKRERVLIKGSQFVDSSIIRYNGKYWLFTNKRNCTDLFIYHANSLQDEFVPHALNPIKNDHTHYRSGGHLFVVDGTLYRPTQNSKIRYGGSLVIKKIKTLTETLYKSEVEFEIHPDMPYNKGLHNISFDSGLTVVDGKKSNFSLFMPFKLFLRYYRMWKLESRATAPLQLGFMTFLWELLPL